MSVIYRSLQQLKKEEAERTSRPTPQAVAPRMSNLVVRALLFLLVFGLLVGSGVFFIRQEVQKIPLPEEPDMPKTAVSTMGGRQQAVEQIMEGNVAEAETGLVQQLPNQQVQQPQAPIVKQKLYREPTIAKKAALDMRKPTKALETHFAKKARKNEDVIALERKLVQASKGGDLGRSKELLNNMTTQIGKKESASKYKWEGYLALKEKRYADAENFFRRAVSIRPSDYVSNINLVYSLLGQGKREEAVRIYRVLLERYPMNERVVKLGKALGEM